MTNEEFLNTIFKRLRGVTLLSLGMCCNARIEFAGYQYLVSIGQDGEWVVIDNRKLATYREFVKRLLEGKGRDEAGNTVG